MLIIAIITYVMNLMDLGFTLHLSHEYGDDIEGNPIGKILIKNKLVAVLVKVAMAIPLYILYYFSYVTFIKVILYVVFGIYVLLTLYHIFILVYLEYHKKKYNL